MLALNIYGLPSSFVDFGVEKVSYAYCFVIDFVDQASEGIFHDRAGTYFDLFMAGDFAGRSQFTKFANSLDGPMEVDSWEGGDGWAVDFSSRVQCQHGCKPFEGPSGSSSGRVSSRIRIFDSDAQHGRSMVRGVTSSLIDTERLVMLVRPIGVLGSFLCF